MKTNPTSIRITESGIKALKSLEAATGKKRIEILSEALVHMHDETVAQPVINLRLLAPSEILTLQNEIAVLQNLHRDKRRRSQIRSSDKHTTRKSIELLEKIDREVDQLAAARLKLGRLGRLAEEFSATDLEHLENTIMEINECIAKAKLHSPDNLPAYELELKILNTLI